MITGYMTISEGYAEVLGLRELVKKLQDEAVLVAAGYPSTRTVWLIIDGMPRQAHPSDGGDHVRWRMTAKIGERRVGFDVPSVLTHTKEVTA